MIIHIIISYDQNMSVIFLGERWIPCQASTSVLCLHYRPETVHYSTKDVYTSEMTFLALHPCQFLSLQVHLIVRVLGLHLLWVTLYVNGNRWSFYSNVLGPTDYYWSWGLFNQLWLITVYIICKLNGFLTI